MHVDGIVGQNMLLRVLGGLSIALAGALLAVWAHMPLPWMLGALLVTAATRIAGLGTVCPRPARNGGQWVIGTSLGLYFTPQVLGHIGTNAGPIIVGMLFALALAFMGTAMLRRFTDADFKTAWFSSAIGGASEMASLAERHGARIDRVATAHSVRVLLVVVTVPFIFQWWGVAGLDPTVPGPKTVDGAGLAALVALTCIGGLCFMKLHLPNPWVLGPMLVAMLYWSVAPVPTLILGTTPGGIAEMAITAKVLQLGVPVVTAFHVTRMVFVVIVTGPIYAFLARRQANSA